MKIKFPKLLAYQKDVFDLLQTENVFFVTFLKSRQSGGSFFAKIIVSYWALKEKCKIGYITPTLKLGKLFYKGLVMALSPFIRSKNSTDLLVEFKNGSTLQFFSAESGESVRGFQFNYLIIDEGAFMKDDFYDLTLNPTQRVIGKKQLLISTPNTKNGFFFRSYIYSNDEEKKRYAGKKITIYDNPFVTEEEIEEIRSTVPDRVFRQEYMSEFLDDDGTVFTNYKNCIEKNPIKTGVYFAGIDWAKENDYTVLTIINDRKQVVYTHRMNGVSYTNQVEIIEKILNEWKPKVTISEENNIGTVVNELLRKVYHGNVMKVTLNNSLKRKIIEQLIVAFEAQTISIPDNEQLLNELGVFSMSYNHKTGNVSYQAKAGLHDDMVISLAYAYYISNRGQIAIR
jgi:phage FluMu gp28-like protein